MTQAGMTSWALLIEYDGAPFVGWQKQKTGISVQEVLETAAARLNAGQPVPSVAAGRTDSGVHAEGQVVRLSLPAHYQPNKIRDALNYHMQPHRVVVLAVAPAPEGWSPRFSAIERAYRYRILNRPARPTLTLDKVWHVHRPLDAVAMQQAGNLLLGKHDFTSFRATACQAKSPVRTIDRLEISRAGEHIEFIVEARSFLHHQVRNIVGTLKLVGEGLWTSGDVAAALGACRRSAAGPTAPADGLTLTRVTYPAVLFLTKEEGQGSALDPLRAEPLEPAT
jgi:tRNA pseudouridine38-40 synthase